MVWTIAMTMTRNAKKGINTVPVAANTSERDIAKYIIMTDVIMRTTMTTMTTIAIRKGIKDALLKEAAER